jgi:hypothetical protein
VVEVAWTEHYVHIALRPLDKDLAHDVIDAAAAVDAPLYDLQLDGRSEGPEQVLT